VARQRDYQAEYRRRIRVNLARGLSRKQARGFHAQEQPRMPNGERARLVSASEVTRGRLAVGTIETMHAVNKGMNGASGELWVRFAMRLGWEVGVSARGRFYTQDNIASEILERMTFRQRDYFFGY